MLSGFSLVELLVATFIFSLIVVTAISVFLNVYSNQNRVRKIQQGVEASRTAMELMAKNIRMGAIDGSYSAESDHIYFYNYSQGKCITYSIQDNKIKFKELSVKRIDQPDCSTASYGQLSDLVSVDNIESLNFKITKSFYGESNPLVGRVTMVIKVEDSNEPAQTTISLRDYLE